MSLVVIFGIYSELLGLNQTSCFLSQRKLSPSQSLKSAEISKRSGVEQAVRRRFHSFLESPRAYKLGKPAHTFSPFSLCDGPSCNRKHVSQGKLHPYGFAIYPSLSFLKCYIFWKPLSLAETHSNQYVLFKLRYFSNFWSEYSHAP